MTTIDTITDAQIEALRNEAGEAGDTLMVAICDMALFGHVRDGIMAALDAEDRERFTRASGWSSRESARRECVDVIRDAEAQR